jgi:hypothetical protein
MIHSTASVSLVMFVAFAGPVVNLIVRRKAHRAYSRELSSGA